MLKFTLARSYQTARTFGVSSTARSRCSLASLSWLPFGRPRRHGPLLPLFLYSEPNSPKHVDRLHQSLQLFRSVLLRLRGGFPCQTESLTENSRRRYRDQFAMLAEVSWYPLSLALS